MPLSKKDFPREISFLGCSAKGSGGLDLHLPLNSNRVGQHENKRIEFLGVAVPGGRKHSFEVFLKMHLS